MLTDFLQLTIYGVVFGSIIALGAIGVSLIFGVLRFAHFAHGDMMTVGAYLALTMMAGFSLPLLPGAIVALAGTAAVAIAIEKTVYGPLRNRGVQPIMLLISSVGIALILRSLVQIFWGSSNLTYRAGIEQSWMITESLRIQPTQVVIIAGAIALMVLLHLFLQHTRMGKAMRAMSDNADLARISGINTRRVVLVTWVIAGVLAAAGGIFLGLDTRLHPVMGWNLLLPVFAAAIFGGIGKPYGAVVGALVIGLAQEYSTVLISSAYKPAVAFAIMVIMLIWRPTGLFGGKVL